MFKTRRERREEMQIRLVILGGAIASLLFIGTLIFSYLEKWSLSQSFYFTTTMLTTRGINTVGPSSATSRIFASLFLLCGVAFVVYALSSFIGFYISYYQERVEERISHAVKKLRKKRKRKPWVILKR